MQSALSDAFAGMNPQEWCGIIAGIVSFAAFGTYAHKMVWGNLAEADKPLRFTWIAFFFVNLAIQQGYEHTDTDPSTWMFWLPWGYVAGHFIIAVLCIPYGKHGWTQRDRICFQILLVGCAVWILGSLFGDVWTAAACALVFFVGSDITSSIPTQLKLWDGDKEDPLSWRLWMIGNVLLLFAVPDWSNPTIWVLPVWWFVNTSMFWVLIDILPPLREKYRILLTKQQKALLK